MRFTKEDRMTLWNRQIPYKRYSPDPAAFALLNQYLTQRIQAYHRKEEGKKPYSLDPVISKFRFTNVFREYDRVSKAIIATLKEHANSDPDVMFANIVKWRMTNTELMAEIWDTEDSFKNWISERYEPIDDNEIFTDAFMTVGLRHRQSVLCPGAKSGLEAVMTIVRKHVLDNKLYTSKIQHAGNPYTVLEEIKTIPGIADFLSYQIFVDCTYVAAFTQDRTFKFCWSENVLSVAGPGCHRGLMLLFPNDPKTRDKIKQPEEHLFWLKEHYPTLCKEMSLKYEPDRQFRERPENDRFINVMAWENVMCEFQKYERLLGGNKVSARKYEGGNV